MEGVTSHSWCFVHAQTEYKDWHKGVCLVNRMLSARQHGSSVAHDFTLCCSVSPRDETLADMRKMTRY